MEINLKEDALDSMSEPKKITIKIGRKKFNIVNIGGGLFINKQGEENLTIQISSNISITLK